MYYCYILFIVIHFEQYTPDTRIHYETPPARATPGVFPPRTRLIAIIISPHSEVYTRRPVLKY